MAILPRTLLTQPAPAAVAAVTLFGVTMLGLAAHDSLERQALYVSYASPCAELESDLGAQKFWQELDYVRYVSCLEGHRDARGAVEAASQGLQQYPSSQLLSNLKGYEEIGLREFDAAARTLERGLRAIPEPTNGVMENNLAWAYLWTGDGGTEQARALYQASLAREPNVCEALHTGLFVEFEIGRTTDGIQQAEAWRNFQSLRNRYQDCENRDTSWDTAVETAGAAVLFSEAEELMGTTWDQRGMGLTMRVTATILSHEHASASVAALCRDAMPLSDLHEQCVSEVQGAIRAVTAHRRR